MTTAWRVIGPPFSLDEVWFMRRVVMEAGGWTAKEVQDLPDQDLWELYEAARLEGAK